MEENKKNLDMVLIVGNNGTRITAILNYQNPDIQEGFRVSYGGIIAKRVSTFQIDDGHLFLASHDNMDENGEYIYPIISSRLFPNKDFCDDYVNDLIGVIEKINSMAIKPTKKSERKRISKPSHISYSTAPISTLGDFIIEDNNTTTEHNRLFRSTFADMNMIRTDGHITDIRIEDNPHNEEPDLTFQEEIEEDEDD